MCLSLAGFMVTGHDRVLYAVSATVLGVSYGLAYPLIQARAVDGVLGELRHWTLWYFSLAYFAGLYGFPLIAGLVITLGGYPALIAVLLIIGVAEFAVSVWTPDPTGRIRAIRPPAQPSPRTSAGQGPPGTHHPQAGAQFRHIRRSDVER
jgi:MFS family permease